MDRGFVHFAYYGLALAPSWIGTTGALPLPSQPSAKMPVLRNDLWLGRGSYGLDHAPARTFAMAQNASQTGGHCCLDRSWAAN